MLENLIVEPSTLHPRRAWRAARRPSAESPRRFRSDASPGLRDGFTVLGLGVETPKPETKPQKHPVEGTLALLMVVNPSQRGGELETYPILASRRENYVAECVIMGPKP